MTLLCRADVIFQFVPEVYGRNVSGLFNCKIAGAQNSFRASLTITVTERSAGVICIINTPEFTVYPGAGSIPVAAASGARIQFSSSQVGKITAASRAFPQGDYDYCFSLQVSGSDNPPVEQCFEYVLAPFAEMNLLDPYNKDQICDKRPLLTWQPLIPAVPGATYQLVLTEIRSGQNATDALNYNLPLINQPGILSPVLPFPPIAQELENKKRYAWQVTAYKDMTILNRSEIWEFTIDCKDSVKKADTSASYRDISDMAGGNYYIADGRLNFSFINAYSAGPLQYKISSMARPDKKLKHLPKLSAISGINKVSIDLVEAGGFVDDEYYTLKVWLPDGVIRTMRFLYKEPK
ncbi:DUF928 domain-containing protein [Mucilaginibacter sp. 21P]|uniref:DUF928 domain-containing protein n=1 Tax=Mucilaginibacter sp. 21P TaxID=2778902 RepID=UPI001C568EAA|nr:DUF928 domain-containing protein [Mucilaginibacter sp. 21P]QXV63630.1 DUF928 domain-containing protein [Mucilaginibacter sp. 21P]